MSIKKQRSCHILQKLVIKPIVIFFVVSFFSSNSILKDLHYSIM